MNIVLKILPFLLLFPSATLSSIQSDSMSYCNRNCPDGNHLGNTVPYPFGFSNHCQIQLNCRKNGGIMIGQYRVRNVTSENILVDLPVNCSRPVNDLSSLYGPNFGISWRNGLLMRNCSIPLNGCAIPTRLLNSNIPTGSCDFSNESVNCYSQAYGNTTLLEFSMLKKTKCRDVFSSVAVDVNNKDLFNNSSSRQLAVSPDYQTVSLDFQTVELGWWLKECDCDTFAKRVKFSVGNGSYGCRCRCDDGYVGDGFSTGDGCRTSSPFDASRRGKNAKVALIGGIFAGASLMAAMASLYYCFHKRKHLFKNKTNTKCLFSESTWTSKIPFYPYKEIERATNSFSNSQRLGTGAYGTVYAGKLHDNNEWVAIKKIKNHDPESFEQVLNEIELLSSVSHPNLVKLLGCCIENSQQILVYEFMPNGTLSQHLQRERGPGIPWTTRLTIATETARAIAYLHTSRSPPIYHRDIKSSNILLDYNFRSKLADFGLSRFGIITDDSHVSTAPQGTPGYVDPQYHQNFHLSDKSDVYSFGVVLIEIITAMKVVDFSRPHHEINLAALAVERIGKGQLDDIIDPFLDPHKDSWTLSSIHKLAELAFRCLAFHGNVRPSMMEVADELEQIKLSSWATMEENNVYLGSSVVSSSSCSSPIHGSEKSFGCLSSKKIRGGSRRLNLSQRAFDNLYIMEEGKDDSPVSVQEPWLSANSSPSTNSLLNNAVL